MSTPYSVIDLIDDPIDLTGSNSSDTSIEMRMALRRNQNLVKQLHKAAKSGDLYKIRSIRESELPRVVIDVRDLLPLPVFGKFIDGNTEVHITAANGHLDCLATLLVYDEKALNIKNKDGYTASHLAVIHQKYSILTLTLQHEARLDNVFFDLCKSDKYKTVLKIRSHSRLDERALAGIFNHLTQEEDKTKKKRKTKRLRHN